MLKTKNKSKSKKPEKNELERNEPHRSDGICSWDWARGRASSRHRRRQDVVDVDEVRLLLDLILTRARRQTSLPFFVLRKTGRAPRRPILVLCASPVRQFASSTETRAKSPDLGFCEASAPIISFLPLAPLGTSRLIALEKRNRMIKQCSS